MGNGDRAHGESASFFPCRSRVVEGGGGPRDAEVCLCPQLSGTRLPIPPALPHPGDHRLAAGFFIRLGKWPISGIKCKHIFYFMFRCV